MKSLNAKVVIDSDFAIGVIDRHLFGSFAEHMGRCIYEGIYQPGHESADEDGFRQDVLEAVKQMGVSIIRYPGGNFVSGHDWREAIGPRESRPVRLDLAWKTVETNRVGTDEFVKWCRKASVEVMLTVNLGTLGPLEAAQYVEYCNFPGGTYWSDKRKENGSPEPYKVKYWCLGNEMDGLWQSCHKTGSQYGQLASQAGKMMKKVDPDIKLIACGSSALAMPTYLQWENDVLEQCIEEIDYLALHTYVNDENTTVQQYLARAMNISKFIEDAVKTADYVAAKKKIKKKVMMSFDEWNVWAFHKPQTSPEWISPRALLEQQYTFKDSLVFGCMILELINHCDRTTMACLAQIVNVIAPIFTKKDGGIIKQSIFYPFAMASSLAGKVALRPVVDCPAYDTDEFDSVPFLESSFVIDRDNGDLTILCVNKSQDKSISLDLTMRGFSDCRIEKWICLNCNELDAKNDFENPHQVEPFEISAEKFPDISGGRGELNLMPTSWNRIDIKRK